MSSLPDFLTRRQLADLIGVTVKGLREMTADGCLPEPLRIGPRTHRYYRDDIIAYLRKLPTSAAAPKAG